MAVFEEPVQILLVDDDKNDYVLTRELLAAVEEGQFDVEWVDTYEAALEAMIQARHDVCLVDYRLGKWDGLELLRAACAGGATIPIIMLTGQGDLDVAVAAMQAGAADYLEKGQLSTPVLERSIRYAVERRRAEEASRKRNQALVLLNRSGQAFSSTLDLDQVLATVLEEARHLLDVTASSIWMIDQETRELVCRQATGPETDIVVGWRLAPGAGIAGWVAAHGESLIVPDAMSDGRHFRDIEDQMGVVLHSTLSVPLRSQRGIIGVLQVLDEKTDRFDAADLQLFEPLAASAAIAIENAWLYQQAQQEIAEREQAEQALRRYAERLRALHTIDGIILAAGSSQEIAQATLEHLQQLVPCQQSSVVTFDLEAQEGVMLAVRRGDEGDLGVGTRVPLGLFGNIDKLCQGEVTEVEDIQALSQISPTVQTLMAQDGCCSYVNVPLVSRDELLGVLGLGLVSLDAFTSRHVEIAHELANQLAVGLQQANLREQIQRHTEALEQQVAERTARLARRNVQLQVAAEVARDATTARSLDDLLTGAADLVRERFGFYHVGIFLVEADADAGDKYAVIRAATGEAGHKMLESHHRLKVGGTGIVGYVTDTGEPRIALDVGTDAVYFDNPLLPETRSEMALPMRVSERVIGALDVQSKRASDFDEEDVRILQVMADQLAVAIERTRLFKQAQTALEERLGLVVANMPIVLFSIDHEGTLTLLEGRGLQPAGLDPRAIIGQSVFEAFRDEPQILANARRALDGETFVAIEEYGEAVFETRYLPLCDADGKVTRILGLAIDVTEHKRLEERVYRQERLAAVGQLAGGIAHDFNNFLMTIMFYAHLLMRGEGLPSDKALAAETIVHEAQRAAGLVQQILDFSRRSVMKVEPINLVSFIEEVAGILRETLPENIQLVTKMEQDESLVNADPTRIQQMVMNLALNARDAMPDGGELRIGLSRMTVDMAAGVPASVSGLELTSGDWVCLSITDTGTGMTDEVRAHLFEPFFTTKGPKGNGLGLAQVYGIIKQHKGDIKVETELGHGTTFRVYLPACTSKEAGMVPAQGAGVPTGHGETILFVEDEDRVREAGQRVLESLGYRVLTASNGQEGLEVFQATDDVALVLTDMVMPVMGGRELIQELKRINPGVKALIITGYTVQEDLQALMEEGFADVVYKPLDVGVLGRTIRQVLGVTSKDD